VDEIITSSWDHTLKIWDAELGGMKSEIVGNKSFFDVHYSPLSKLVITASADKQIRLYDPKVKGKTL
jgi:WD domain, G-beta repeat.